MFRQVQQLHLENSQLPNAAEGGEVRRLEEPFHVQEGSEFAPVAITALEAAYPEGEPRLAERLAYLRGNYAYLQQFIAEHLPQLRVLPLETTYLVWVDCAALPWSSAAIARILLEEHQRWVHEEIVYGSSGEGFLRLNIACPRAVLAERLDHLKQALGPVLATSLSSSSQS